MTLIEEIKKKYQGLLDILKPNTNRDSIFSEDGSKSYLFKNKDKTKHFLYSYALSVVKGEIKQDEIIPYEDFYKNILNLENKKISNDLILLSFNPELIKEKETNISFIYRDLV